MWTRDREVELVHPRDNRDNNVRNQLQQKCSCQGRGIEIRKIVKRTKA